MSKTTKAAVPVNAQPHVWSQLLALYGQRGTAKNRVTNLTQKRGVIEKELREMGKTPSKERDALCVQHWDTNEALKKERERIGWLSDQSDEVLEKGLQGELYMPPAEMPDDADCDEPEEEPELVKHAREERAKRGLTPGASAANEPIKNALGHELKVGMLCRFTSRTNSDQWFEGEVISIGSKGAGEVKAVTLSPAMITAKCLPGPRSVNFGVVNWVKIGEQSAPAAADEKAPVKAGSGESPASDGTGRFTFPGTFVLIPSRHGAPPQRFKVTSNNILLAVVSEACGVTPGSDAECTIHEIKGEVYIGGGRVATLHQVADDADALDTVKPEPVKEPKTSSKPLVEVKDKHGRKKKATA